MGAEEFMNNLLEKAREKALGEKKINDPVSCPFCNKIFDSFNEVRFNVHIRSCGMISIQVSKSCDLYPPSQDLFITENIFKNFPKYKPIKRNRNSISFDEKLEKLFKTLQSKAIDWKEGFGFINVNRQKILKESMDQIKNINLYRELKINFIGEVSIDAGGVLREWFTSIFKVLEGEKLKLFIRGETEIFSYIINPFLFYNDENFSYLNFVGKLIVKALLQHVTINICFNKLLYQMILLEKINFQHLVFIDEGLYCSLKNIKESLQIDKNLIEELGLFYCIEMRDSYNHVHSFELIENGRNIPVKDIDDYIEKRINFLIGIYEPFISKIRENIFQYIPKEIITDFTSDEFELVLNGRPFIDIEEWKLFTDYNYPYNENHNVIIWFWQILEGLSQKELSNLLLFTTGSTRVPLGGFASLESNRGTISKFTIACVPYVRNTKNFIKAHTCFNKLDVPCYESKKELKEQILFVTKNEMFGFGID